MTNMQICEVGATLALLCDAEICMCNMRPYKHYTWFMLPKI